jgi:hypothetical protein
MSSSNSAADLRNLSSLSSAADLKVTHVTFKVTHVTFKVTHVGVCGGLQLEGPQLVPFTVGKQIALQASLSPLLMRYLTVVFLRMTKVCALSAAVSRPLPHVMLNSCTPFFCHL